MSVKVFNENNFDEEVKKDKGTVLVDFYADWCGPCKIMSPVIDNIAEENENIKVGKVNVDESPSLAEEFQVMSIPTIVVFKNGTITKTFVGITDKEEIKSAL